MSHINSRAFAVASIGALVLGTGVAAHAAAGKATSHPKPRVVKISYTGGCGFDVNAAGNGVAGAPGTCALGDNYALAKKGKEKYLSIKVVDTSGRPVSGSLWLQGGTGNAVDEPFCGALKNYRMTQGTYTMDLNAAADSACPGVATSGAIQITYSATPQK
jgi:hypothetical protein